LDGANGKGDSGLSTEAKTKSLITFLAFILLSLGLVLSSTAKTPGHLYDFHYENVLGTSLELKVVAESETQAEKAEQAALAEIDREAHILSSWDSQSEFSNWFRTKGQPVHISPELFEVFRLFDEWREKTGGALDPSAEAVTRVWKHAAAEKRVPTRAELDAAVASVRRVHWTLDPVNRTATHTDDAPLALNSFVKSYIAGRAANAALNASAAQALVINIGGDLIVRGDWRELVDVSDPRSDAENAAPMAQLEIRDRAVATSGDYRRSVEIAGHHYSHIVDPRTGMPAEQIISSTVIAESPSIAGALATAFSVLTPEESARVAASVPGVEYLLVKKDGEQIASAGWRSYEAPHPLRAGSHSSTPTYQTIAAQSAGAQWDPKYELTVSLELSLIEGMRVHRPYVAVWIENENHAPVRTISLWFGKYKYLNELRAWSRDESSRSTSEDTHILNSVSSATRPPGKYTFQWDGKDDAGNPVKAGKYIVLIEATREHGTYQLLHEEMEFNGTPKKFEFPGGTEIASATIDYHKIAQ
jgi:thiamine biosynthesis lipoprotein